MNRKVLKIKQNIVLCLVSLSVLALSCNRTDIEEEYIGKSGFLVTLADGVSVETRSTPLQLENPLTTDFNLKIVRTSTDTPVYDGKYKEELIQAPAGFYNVTAWFGENPVLAVDTPYYLGTVTGVEVKKDTPAEVSVSCKVANALLSVVYDESIAKVYDSYYVTVSVGGESREIRGNQSAYFRAGSVATVAFHGVLKGESEEHVFELQHEGPLAPLGAAEHAVLNLSIEAGVMVSVEKLDIETVTVGETIPLEYLPKPKLESTDFVENELSFAETETKSAVINLKLSSPLQDLKLKFNSSDAKFAGLVADKEYVLSNADDKVAVETALGITLPEIGVSEGSIDFSSLIPQLMTDAGNTVLSTIEVDVKANNRWSSEDEAANRVYTLKCNKPEFSISVDERNCWAREFTIDEVKVTAGNAETIKNNLVYQYFDGTEWKDCITREAVKGRTQQFEQRAEEIQNKVYKVRALYRGVIASAEAEATLETPVQLPNSGMEEWHYSGTFSHNVRSYYPYAENGESFWATNNDYTTRYRQNTFGYPYNCFPAVSYVPGRGEGWAAELRNTGSGAGNEVDSWFTDDFVDNRNRVAGILFVGDFSCKTGVSATNYSYTKTDGKPFDVRPSILKFWYKYLPYNSDTWQVKIQLLDENKTPLVEETFQSNLSIVNDYQKVEVKLDYKEGQCYNKCKYIYIIFQSTINEGENMPFEWYKPEYILWKDNEQVKYEEPHVGSVLTIDDISLVYDK